MSSTLQKVNLKIYDTLDCARLAFPEDAVSDYQIYPNNICAGIPDGKGLCDGNFWE